MRGPPARRDGQANRALAALILFGGAVALGLGALNLWWWPAPAPSPSPADTPPEKTTRHGRGVGVSAVPQAVPSVTETAQAAAGPGGAPLQAPPPKEPEWVLVDERVFNGRLQRDRYLPYFVPATGMAGLHTQQETIRWHHYSDEPEVTYQPDQELLLDSSRVFDRWVRLSGLCPHTLKWEIFLFSQFQGLSARLEADGLVVGHDRTGVAVPFPGQCAVRVVLERLGQSLRMEVEGVAQRLPVAGDDREPLRLTAQGRPLAIRHSRLYFGKGESLAPPPRKEPLPGRPPKWETVFAEGFQAQGALRGFQHWPAGAVFQWDEGGALQQGPNLATKNEECYVMLKQSLPGDIRMRFRIRSFPAGQVPFFGVLLGVKGKLRQEDGYFIEWNSWQVQIKKSNVRKAAVEVGYPKPTQQGQWLDCRLERLGPKITMYTEGQEVLTWTDPYPYTDSGHDLLAFYSWRVPHQLDDLIIERNRHDPVRRREDQPVFEENFLQGRRDRDRNMEERLEF